MKRRKRRRNLKEKKQCHKGPEWEEGVRGRGGGKRAHLITILTAPLSLCKLARKSAASARMTDGVVTAANSRLGKDSARPTVTVAGGLVDGEFVELVDVVGDRLGLEDGLGALLRDDCAVSVSDAL